MHPIVLAQMIAAFQFPNGTVVSVSKDTVTDPAKPVVVQARYGVRCPAAGISPCIVRLSNEGAQMWGGIANNASVLDSTVAYADSLDIRIGHKLGFTSSIKCGKEGCKFTAFNITLWGSDYTYLRPGLLPRHECLMLAKALYVAAGKPGVAFAYPYVWKAVP